jgi:hypothetical protein
MLKKVGFSCKIGLPQLIERSRPPMTTISQILGGAQILLGISYDVQDCFEQYLTEEQRAFLASLRLIGQHQPQLARPAATTGRPAYENEPFFRAFLAKSFFRIPTTDDLRKRLKTDSNLRLICGFTTVPSAATFSRRLTMLAVGEIPNRAMNQLGASFHENRIVGHICRDSTAITAREAPANKKKDVKLKPKPKRGRPKKGKCRPEKKRSRIEHQLKMKPGKAVAELDSACAWGCKTNRQGNVMFWKGYKLHLDVTDRGIPVTAVVTGANVHDSQVAIPMEKWTERKLDFLYSVMDSAYDAAPIIGYIKGKGRVPLIDPNKRHTCQREPFTPAQRERFNIRTTVERANSHLKDWLLPAQVFVRGIAKVTFLLLCGVLMLAAIKVLQATAESGYASN